MLQIPPSQIGKRLKLEMKTYTLDQIQDKLIGKSGTPERDIFENALEIDLIGKSIKQSQQKLHITQDEMGKLFGIQKRRNISSSK